MQLQFVTDCNFGSASTTICERGYSKQKRVKSDRKSRLKLELLYALMPMSICGLLMENIDWARNFDTRKPTENYRRALRLELDEG